MYHTYAETHWTWLEDTLAASTAAYLLVVGHYPVYSGGSHGNTFELVSKARTYIPTSIMTDTYTHTLTYILIDTEVHS